MNDLARTVEALLFLSSEPVSVERLADAAEVSEGEIVEALARLREHYAEGYRGVVLREVAGGFTLATDPVAERAARRLLARPRTPPLTQAQAECLAIVSYLQPVSRPEIARIRGVASESAYDPVQLAEALGGLLTVPPPLDLRHVRRPAVSVEQRLRHLRDLLARRSRFSFDDAVEGVDRLTEAVTLFALLELYKAGEAKWEQEVPFGPITVVPPS